MEEEKRLSEPSAVYATAPALDLSRLTILQQNGQPVAVLVPYVEYKRWMDERWHRQVDLRARGIDAAQASELRARLATFAVDWDSPEMSMYDDYDAAKSGL
jgi:hypothetical protein